MSKPVKAIEISAQYQALLPFRIGHCEVNMVETEDGKYVVLADVLDWDELKKEYNTAVQQGVNTAERVAFQWAHKQHRKRVKLKEVDLNK